jgi:hypothetical protein
MVTACTKDILIGLPRGTVIRPGIAAGPRGSRISKAPSPTCIGLTRAHQLAASMSGRVDVVNTEPGAEFGACFSVITRESC